MHAVDTNVLVRLLTGDDPAQTKRAAALFRKETIFIPKTVLLETEWVLRRLYGLDQNVVMGAFGRLMGLANVEIEHVQAAALAMQWYGNGMDFADALHLASSKAASKFHTFDAQLKKSSPKESVPVVLL